MLGDCEVMAFVPTAHPDRAKSFYRDTLGLELTEDSPFALVFRAGRTMLRVQKVREFTPLPGTVLGWRVPDIRAAVQALSGEQVSFERYDGMGQDALGIWLAPGGGKVAWFKDPDGNTLSLTEFPPGQS
jgi:catechol 2,3-dioxygenase-like lactoylglutathione lyase family enzyme